MTKQKLISKSELARQCGVTRQAVGDAIANGILNQVGAGRNAKINPLDYKTIQYKKSHSFQREGKAEKLAKKIIKDKKQKLIEHKKDGDFNDEYQKEDNVSIDIGNNEQSEDDLQRLLVLAGRLEIAKTEKMEQQAIAEKLKNAKLRGELIIRECVYDNLFLYLDKLHSNLERLADSFLSDVGGRIIDAKKVLPEYRSKWKNEVMSQIDNAKQTIVKNIQDLEKGK